jgi:hypothetical protein
MNPAITAAACAVGALTEISISCAPSARSQSSAVIGHGQAGSTKSQRCALSGPSMTTWSKSMLRPAVSSRNFSCSGVNNLPLRSLPAATRLISPLRTGMENEADFTSPFSLASTSILKPAYLRQSCGSLSTSTGRNLIVLSCWSPITRRALTMIPASSSAWSGVSKKYTSRCSSLLRVSL